MKRSIRILGLAACGMALAACGNHGSDRASSNAPDLPAARVTVAEVAATSSAALVDLTGVVRASDVANVAPKVMGVIGEMPVDLGQRVVAGQLLVRIQAPEIGAKVAQAEAQYTQAKRDLDRETELLSKGASTSEMVKNLTDRLAIMEGMLTEARAMQSYMEIRAPFAGAVSRKMADVGSLASPGMPLLSLENTDTLEIEAHVPESLGDRLEIGSGFVATIPSSGDTLTVRLSEVSSGYDAATRSVAARFTIIGKSSVKPGQYARIQIPGSEQSRLLVPASAISRKGQLDRVFVEADGRAELRLVKLGASADGFVEALAGIDAGERVVTSGGSSLRDGQKLEILP